VTNPDPTRETYFIAADDLLALTAELLGAGTQVIAPVAVDVCASPSAIASSACLRPGVAPVDIEYRALADAAELDLSRGLPVLSLKQYFLPEHEALCPRSSRPASCWRRSPATAPPWPSSTRS